MIRFSYALLIPWIAVSAVCSPSQAATFTGLGDLPGGTFYTYASGVSDDGSVVVGRGYSDAGLEAFRWTLETGAVGLGDLPGGLFNSTAFGVSGDGKVIVGQGVSDISPEAMRWTEDGGMVPLGLPDAGYSGSAGWRTNYDGSAIVGWAYGASVYEGFYWQSDNTVTGIGDLPGGQVDSDANDVTADGSMVVGQAWSGSGGEVITWTPADGGSLPAQMTPLGDLPGGAFQGIASAVSPDGSVIVGTGTVDAGYEAFKWTEAQGMIPLGDLPGGIHQSTALDVNGDGSVVVGSSHSDTLDTAFFWDETHGMRRLDDILTNDHGLGAAIAGWELISANGITPDGRYIVGSGNNPQGESESWIVDLVPEPTALSLIGIGGLALLRYKGR